MINAECREHRPGTDGMMKALIAGGAEVPVPYVGNAKDKGLISFHPHNVKYDADSPLKFTVSSVQYLGYEYDYVLTGNAGTVRMRSTFEFKLGDEIPVTIEKAIWLGE